MPVRAAPLLVDLLSSRVEIRPMPSIPDQAVLFGILLLGLFLALLLHRLFR